MVELYYYIELKCSGLHWLQFSDNESCIADITRMVIVHPDFRSPRWWKWQWKLTTCKFPRGSSLNLRNSSVVCSCPRCVKMSSITNLSSAGLCQRLFEYSPRLEDIVFPTFAPRFIAFQWGSFNRASRSFMERASGLSLGQLASRIASHYCCGKLFADGCLDELCRLVSWGNSFFRWKSHWIQLQASFLADEKVS